MEVSLCHWRMVKAKTAAWSVKTLAMERTILVGLCEIERERERLEKTVGDLAEWNVEEGMVSGWSRMKVERDGHLVTSPNHIFSKYD